MQSKQISSFGTLSSERITADLLMDMLDVDMQVLMEGAVRLRERLKTFRGADQKPTQGSAGAA